MMIAAVDQCDIDRQMGKTKSRAEAGKAATDDHDTGALARGFLRCGCLPFCQAGHTITFQEISQETEAKTAPYQSDA